MWDPVAAIGGTGRIVTLVTLIIHFIHPLLCLANYLDWVRFQSDDEDIGGSVVGAYLAMTIISILSYLLIASVFYVWAWRYPEPEEFAKRHRIYGVIVNLLLSDFPIFVVEVTIVWSVGFRSGIQGTSFIFTCISMLYSGVRVWTFVMVKAIKSQAIPKNTVGGFMMNARGFDPTFVNPSANAAVGGSRTQFSGAPPSEMYRVNDGLAYSPSGPTYPSPGAYLRQDGRAYPYEGPPRM